MKKILKTKPSDNGQIDRISRRYILSNQEYEQWWYDNWFTDEFSDESSELTSESEESIRNLSSLTEIFQIILRQLREIDFPHVKKFDILRTIFSRRDKKWNFCLFDKKRIYSKISEKAILMLK